MTAPQTALLMIGSAKPAGESSSAALGGYLLARLATHGIATETRSVARALRTPARTAELLQAVDQADLLILAFPLYVDSLPYLVTAALEQIAGRRLALPAPRPGSFLAIANCGFPEAQHNETALAICEQFAAAAGYDWAGGLALGAGGAVHGRPLAAGGGLLRNVVAGLDQAAAALTAGQPVPAPAVELLARPLLPARVYTLMGGLGWLLEARRHGALLKLRARPHQVAG